MSVDIGTSGPIRIFTPECCRELAHELSSISEELGGRFAQVLGRQQSDFPLKLLEPCFQKPCV